MSAPPICRSSQPQNRPTVHHNLIGMSKSNPNRIDHPWISTLRKRSDRDFICGRADWDVTYDGFEPFDFDPSKSPLLFLFFAQSTKRFPIHRKVATRVITGLLVTYVTHARAREEAERGARLHTRDPLVVPLGHRLSRRRYGRDRDHFNAPATATENLCAKNLYIQGGLKLKCREFAWLFFYF